MEQFKGKVAIVTGASSGTGAATAKALVAAGMKVVGVARRTERIEQAAKTIKNSSGKLYAVKADLTNEQDILHAFKWTSDNVGPVSVLINNAGIMPDTTLINGDADKWRNVLDTNVLSVAIASREAIKIMGDNKIDGHIINVNSLAGHSVPNIPFLNIYPAPKFAVTALTETLRLELIRLGSKIKITSLSPGYVKTEMAEKISEEFQQLLTHVPGLESEDLANAVLYILGTPPHVQVTELCIRPAGDKF